MGSFSIWHWLIVLVIVVLVFGTKRLGSLGTDLGVFVKNLRTGLKEGEDASGAHPPIADDRSNAPIDAAHNRDKNSV